MAEVKQAKVVSRDLLGEATCRVVCEMVEPRELGFTGGQYIIVNSKRLLASGKIGKRAYSLPSRDAEQNRFEFIVRQIPGGVGSKFIHELHRGDTFEFSGPWGKYLPVEGKAEKTLIVATDTGLTASLGLVRGQKFAAHLPWTHLLWFLPARDYFIPLERLHEWTPSGIFCSGAILCPETSDEARAHFFSAEVDNVLREESFDRVYLSGDGKALTALKALLLERGYAENQILVETFFNHLERKAVV
ncbi:MAG: FAD-dependent oxidoreductase [Candidatus Omnitrophica bacterium]|nr:FAD-dependent oxidoreductase [Candidatus Omnitrophota bacterium]